MKSLVVGTAGHIDHGKSALVRALTGTDPDRLKEEQARGITIDLGFAHTVEGDLALAFVDVPGHERFVKNMLAGAAGVDAVMLVIAADESVMPQTREHFHICRLLHVPSGLIVLTKIDAADSEMRELARMEARELTAGSFLDGAAIVEVSSRTGEGIDMLRRELRAIGLRAPARAPSGGARLPIDRSFSMRGFGTVVTGTLVSGVIATDDELEVLPQRRRVKVRGIQMHGAPAARAGAGRRVAVNLAGVDRDEVERGNTLCAPRTLEPTRRFDVQLQLLEGVRPLKHGARVRFHQGTTEVLGRVALVPPSGPGDGGAELQPGKSGYARIRLEKPAVLTRRDRFILRAYSPSVTIGGGVVMDPHPPRGPVRTAAGMARFARLDLEAGASADRAVVLFVEEAKGRGMPVAALAARAGLGGAEAAQAVERLLREGAVVAVADLLVAPASIARLTAQLLEALGAHHAAQPLSEGLPREEARERVFGLAAPAVFEHVLASLVAAGRIAARDRLSLTGHTLSLSPEEAAAHAALERVYRDAALAPPDLSSAAAAAGVTPAVADRVSKLLLRQKTLVKIDVLLFHAAALRTLKAEVQALKGGAGTAKVDVPAFKERYGISRKYAIPLLEYLDRERVTRRVGDTRIVV